MGTYGCLEVTIGINGHERVDYLTYDTKGIFRCYEVKVSKQDFHSKNKLSFVGDYNYIAAPDSLVRDILPEIPAEVGVMSYLEKAPEPFLVLVRKAKKLPLSIPREVLKDSMIRSMSREVGRMMESEDVSYIKTINRELGAAQKQVNRLKDERSFWLRRISELMDFVESVVGKGFWDTGAGAAFDPGQLMGKNPFTDGRPYLPAQYPSMTATERANARQLVHQYAQQKHLARQGHLHDASPDGGEIVETQNIIKEDKAK